MEDILGIIIFILFIITRTMVDRKKGMAKQQVVKKNPPAAGQKRTVSREDIPVQPRHVSFTRKPAAESLSPLSVEGKSLYESLPYMGGIEPEPESEIGKEQAGHTQTLAVLSEPEPEQADVLTYADLRKAVIWSEILQKPRFRTGLRYLR